MASLIHPAACGVRKEDLIGHKDAVHIVKSCSMLNANILMVTMAAGALVLVFLAYKIKQIPYWAASIPLVIGALGYLGPFFATRGMIALNASYERSGLTKKAFLNQQSRRDAAEIQATGMDNIASAIMTNRM